MCKMVAQVQVDPLVGRPVRSQQHAITRVPSSFHSGPPEAPDAAGFSDAQPSPKRIRPIHEPLSRFLTSPPFDADSTQNFII